MASLARQSKSQQRGNATKRRLIDATKSLLAQYDYHSITLDQVAAAVPVSKSSVLWHFGNKEALLTEAVVDLFQEIDTHIDLRKHKFDSFEERLHYLFEIVADYGTNNPNAKGIAISLLLNQQIPQSIHDRIREQWQRHVAAIREFLATEDAPVSNAAALALMALLHGCYLQWYLDGCRSNLKDDLDRAVRALRFDALQSAK